MVPKSVLDALSILRDPSLLQWYVVPLLVIVIYVYSLEIKKKNWNRVVLGIAFLAGEFIWEMFNSLVFTFTSYSPLWVTPGATAYLILIGLNVEIMFFFALAPFIIFNFLDAYEKDDKIKILGKNIPNRLIIPLLVGLACVLVEILLNLVGLLIWNWWFWSLPNVFLIIIAYTLPMYVIAWFYDRYSLKTKGIATIVIVALAITIFCILSPIRLV